MTETIGRFQLRKRLGGGGFGEVFLAEDPTIGRQVAIKVFRPKDENLIAFATSTAEEGLQVLRDRFLNEARILATLEDEPHIVNVLDFGELADGTPYYVMPYLPHSLADELGKDVYDVNALAELPAEQRPRAMPLDRALDVIDQTLQGLAATHARGLIHRDIKPGNLMLTEGGQIRVVDFGIAKTPDSKHSTVSHLGLGSRNYMAPEQRESAKHVDARADIYSLAVVGYRALTGKLPIGRFADPNVAVPSLGLAMNTLLLKMLAQDKNERPANAGEALAQFQLARQSVGQAGISDTATWSGEGEAGIRDDLKPLRGKIIELLGEFGRVTRADWPRLQALAAIADLDDDGLKKLISEVRKDDKSLQSKHKLVDVIERQLKQAGAALSSTQLDAFEEAAEAVGWDRVKLDALMQRALADGAPAARAPANAPNANAPNPSSSNPRNTGSTKPGSAQSATVNPGHLVKPSRAFPARRLVTILATLLIVAGTGWGIYQWRQSQIAENERLAQQSLAAADQQQAWSQAQSADTPESYAQYLKLWPEGAQAAKARSLQSQREEASRQAQMSDAQREQAHILNVQDYLNRLGYRVAENGEADERTTAAIRLFEKQQKLVETGKADEILSKALIEEYERRDAAAWAQAIKQDTEAAFNQYHQDYPQGANGVDVEARIAAVRQREQARQAEQTRLAEERSKAAEAKKVEDARLAEANRKAAEAKQVEEARLAEEKRKAEEARVAEEKRKAEAAKAAELARYKDNGNGTITDSKTGLVWAQKDNGSNVNWKQATSYCSGKGMRLPRIEELAGIYHASGNLTTSCGDVTCKTSPLFRLSSYWFWSSTQKVSSEAWVFTLDGGSRVSSDVGYSGSVRALCVGRS